jgi:hypothetical protein
MGPPCRALNSPGDRGRDDHTAVTWAWRVALMAAMCAVAAQPYPITATLYFLLIVSWLPGGDPLKVRGVMLAQGAAGLHRVADFTQASLNTAWLTTDR